MIGVVGVCKFSSPADWIAPSLIDTFERYNVTMKEVFYVRSQFTDYLHEIFAEFGSITIKKMFGGHGVFYDGLMIGLVAEDTLYLKADEQLKPDFIARGLTPFQYNKGNKTMSMSYYLAPEEAMDNPSEMADWAGRAYDAARRSKK